VRSFQNYKLDISNHCLWRAGERVRIAPRAFDILRFLVENAGSLITHELLLDTIWPETYVNPEILRKYILEIRKALGDDFKRPIFIETHPKRGYRFIAPVEDRGATGEETGPAYISRGADTNIEILVNALCEALRTVSDLQNVVLVIGCIESGDLNRQDLVAIA
jgi:DNA-binding winged helix-turn-helix (wHTH) protein